MSRSTKHVGAGPKTSHYNGHRQGRATRRESCSTLDRQLEDLLGLPLELALRKALPRSLELSPPGAPLGALAGSLRLLPERALGVVDPEALAAALEAIDGALPREALREELGSFPKGGPDVCGLDPDRRLGA